MSTSKTRLREVVRIEGVEINALYEDVLWVGDQAEILYAGDQAVIVAFGRASV